MVKLNRVDLDGIEFLVPGPVDPAFPPGFFDRVDPTPDTRFYDAPRLVTHIDRAAIDAVGELYEELGLRGEVLDLMSSWISHFRRTPARLTVLGLNDDELRANRQAGRVVVRDLNIDPTLPFADASFDDVVCCVSIDYLVRPLDVFREVARVLRIGGRFVVTFSDRCFPTKAIRGWLETDDGGHVEIVRRYFELAGGFGPATSKLRSDPADGADPLYGVWASRR
ncbi:MAG: methyltransferase domain-containing protein [Chloroflexi bacterium]|nr:methyltransferase domain-containing protein [Chloroflexota bacterium]